MTAQIILCDFKGKTWTSEKRVREQELHRQAVEIANVAFPSVFGVRDVDDLHEAYANEAKRFKAERDNYFAPERDPA